MSLSNEKIEFIQYHEPGLTDGDYKITVQQTLKASGWRDNESFNTTHYFNIAGPRFQLTPQDTQNVFPPKGSLGEYSNVLPHVVLTRSTLPWERSGWEANSAPPTQNLPWLALLLFNTGETPTPQVMTLQDLMNTSSYPAKFPEITLETGQQQDEKVTVIDVPWSLLQEILPTTEDLSYLAHVRQRKGVDGKPTGDEMSVVVGNRLGQAGAGKANTVHLVSVEGRYTSNGFDSQKAADTDLVRLVSLQSWQFTCLDPKQSFKELLLNLDRSPGTLQIPSSPDAKADPKNEAAAYLARGDVPLKHYLRQGSTTVSFYHSPLLPTENSTSAITLPVQASDELMRYDPANGFFDGAYAAAWELGRLLALASKFFSISLYQFKCRYQQQRQSIEQSMLSHWPNPNPLQTENVTVPPAITTWFENLGLLKGVPFRYLVTDGRMLPKESLRFFQVDPLWMDCLLDGAFSVGRSSISGPEKSIDYQPSSPELVTGFLLRSAVVSGWPNLEVEGYSMIADTKEGSYASTLNSGAVSSGLQTAITQRGISVPKKPTVKTTSTLSDNKTGNGWQISDPAQELPTIHISQQENGNLHVQLSLLRKDLLSPNVLICLFKGAIDGVNIHEKPETLHFGLDVNDPPAHPPYYKELRDSQGVEQAKLTVPISWKNGSSKVIDISALALAIKKRTSANTFTSAQFALQMIEGVEEVQFKRGN